VNFLASVFHFWKNKCEFNIRRCTILMQIQSLSKLSSYSSTVFSNIYFCDMFHATWLINLSQEGQMCLRRWERQVWSRVWSRFLVAKVSSKFPRNIRFVDRVIPVWQMPIASANTGLIVFSRENLSRGKHFWNRCTFEQREQVSRCCDLVRSLSVMIFWRKKTTKEIFSF